LDKPSIEVIYTLDQQMCQVSIDGQLTETTFFAGLAAAASAARVDWVRDVFQQ
jgi:hypothetical protein